MSPRIILASVLGLSVLCSSAAFAQTSSGPGGGTSGTTGGSMGSGTAAAAVVWAALTALRALPPAQ